MSIEKNIFWIFNHWFLVFLFTLSITLNAFSLNVSTTKNIKGLEELQHAIQQGDRQETSAALRKLYNKFEWNYIYNKRDTLTLWNESFAHLPEVPMWSQFKLLIGFKNQCDSQVTAVWTTVKEYGSLLRDKSSTADQLKEKQKQLHEIVLGNQVQSDNCTLDIQKHYIGASVALLTRADRTIKDSVKKGLFRLPIESNYAYLVFSWLYQDKIIPVVDKNIFQTQSPHSTLGTFDCMNETFLISVLANPLNLAAIVIHEFQHMLGDKLSHLNVRLPNQGEGAFDIPTGKPLSQLNHENFRQFLVIDESLAALRAAWFQKKYQVAEWHTSTTPDVINDMTFFRSKGYLETLLNYLGSKHKKSSNRNDDYIDHLNFNEVATLFLLGADDKNLSLERKNFLRQVFKIYFNKSPTQDELDILEPQTFLNHLITDSVGIQEFLFLQTLFSFGIDEEIPLQWTSTHLSMEQFLKLYSDPRSHIFWMQYSFNKDPGSLNSKIILDARHILRVIAHITAPLFDRQSNVCNDLQTLAQSHDSVLKNYLGNQIPTKNITQKNQKSEDSNRRITLPGGEGVRPGGEGVRPGGEGVRPSNGALRPCIELGIIL